MTYANFLIGFILPPLLILFSIFAWRPSPLRPWFAFAAGILIILALAYTTPWDNYLVASGVWNYSPHRVLATIGYVPVEEYTFFVLQTILTSLWCYLVQMYWPVVETPAGGPILKILGALILLLIWIASFWFVANECTRYLGLILVWALPVIILQWWVAAVHLPANWKILMATIFVPTFYLSAADAYAVSDGIWTISLNQTMGLTWFGLPIEEVLFFFVTNVMVGQGLIFFIAKRESIASSLASRSRA